MLTRVAYGRARFTLPGLTADARGVVSGRQLALRLSSVDRATSFLRILSAGGCPDEVWAGMRMVYARAAGGIRELVVLVPHTSTEVSDGIARAARMASGQAYTGTSRHFVQYRDRNAPFGYDAESLASDPADFVFYALDRTDACRLEGELAPDRFILRMQPRRNDQDTGASRTRNPFASREGSRFYLTVRRGLGPTLAEYLFRAGVRSEAVVCDPETESPFNPVSPFWLFRLHEPPPRLHGLLQSTPGLRLYRPVLDNVAVALGFSHPLNLEGCRAALPRSQFVLFPPPPEKVILFPSVPEFASLGVLVRIAVPSADDHAPLSVASRPAEEIEVPLRLRASSSGGARAVATLIPWTRVSWLRRICYALPATALGGYRVALLEAGVLVVAPDRLEGIPFGQLLEEAAPGVLVPVGARFHPAVSPELIRERLGPKGNAVWVFPSLGASPLAVPDAGFQPLERRIVANVVPPDGSRAAPLVPMAPLREPAGAPEVENDPLGLLPVWGIGKQ
jgi:hypothetical protein